MFLTGFDATTLNTLFVDKRLVNHGLIQAFSRTNRILNSVKTYGNIVSFRDLEDATNDAIALFGNKEAHSVVLLKPYAAYFEEYGDLVQELRGRFPLGEVIAGEAAQKEFVALFGAILRVENILTSFDDFSGHEILAARESQDYRSLYLDFYSGFRQTQESERESIIDDILFEIELIKQVEVNVDYILMLVENGRAKHEGQFAPTEELGLKIQKAVDASPSLRSKKDLIMSFVASVSADGDVDQEWREFVEKQRARELSDIVEQEKLDVDGVEKLVASFLHDGHVPATGTALAALLPPMSKFAPNDAYNEAKIRVLGRLTAFVERFSGLG
jgi:type I restriction enzyme R subunit